jgi:hypothetical protein
MLFFYTMHANRILFLIPLVTIAARRRIEATFQVSTQLRATNRSVRHRRTYGTRSTSVHGTICELVMAAINFTRKHKPNRI